MFGHARIPAGQKIVEADSMRELKILELENVMRRCPPVSKFYVLSPAQQTVSRDDYPFQLF
jgi:hypothetical protein